MIGDTAIDRGHTDTALSWCFGQPVLVDSEVRLRATLVSIVNLRGVCKATIGAELEIVGQAKPAFKGDVVFLYHFTE